MRDRLRSFLQVLLGGLAGAVAWWAGLLLVFGPAQALLADPSLQSAKFLAAFMEPPLPRMARNPEILAVGLLLIALIHAAVYATLRPKLNGGVWRRGATFGLIAWALMVPWFEFYLPWNVMLEPWPLVLLEVACWLAVMLAVGASIALAHAGVDRLVTRPAPENVAR